MQEMLPESQHGPSPYDREFHHFQKAEFEIGVSGDYRLLEIWEEFGVSFRECTGSLCCRMETLQSLRA